MKKNKKDIDIESLNEVISISKKILKIGFFMSIVCIVLLGTYVLKEWSIFKFIKDLLLVISPIFIGLIIAWLFDPIVSWLQSKKIPRILGCILVYLVFFGGIGLIIYLMLPAFSNQIKDFIAGIPDTLRDIRLFVNKFINSINNNYNYDLTSYKDQIYSSMDSISKSITTNLPNTIFNVVKGIISGSITFVLGIMIGFYMLYDFDKINKNFIKILPRKWKKNAIELTVRINDSLRGYVQGVFIVMFFVFVTQSIGLTLAGLKAPLVFALFCAITDIIPYFGPYIGAIPAIIVGFTISPVVGIGCIVSILIVQLLENNFYQPLIMGHTMKLHPVTIMVGLLVFEHFFGIIGMIVATPVIACLKIVLGFINEKKGIMEKVTGKEVIEKI
ncbi:MAG: AI-2E family transporter [Bacilli bacterium]|nr:AI-2E family transporter [Bacilli bacterium]